MSRLLPEYVTSAMTAPEVLAAHMSKVGVLLSGDPEPPEAPDRDLALSAEELLDEVRVWLADVTRFRKELAMPDRAWQVANMAGGLRDAQRQRGGDYRGIGHRADLICYWLVNQAARSGYEASLQAAVLAAEDDERERELAKELNDVIVGLVGGSVSNDRFVQMMKAANKRSTKARMAADPPERPAPNAIPFNTVLSVLEAMFNEQASSATFKAVWDAFKAFTSIPVRGVSSAGELLLFEYGISQSVGVAAGSAGFARLVRQFEVTDADGVPDHAEQLSCDWTFDPTRLSLDARATAIWSDGDASTWFAEVESDPVFNELLALDDPLVVTTDLFSTE